MSMGAFKLWGDTGYPHTATEIERIEAENQADHAARQAVEPLHDTASAYTDCIDCSWLMNRFEPRTSGNDCAY